MQLIPDRLVATDADGSVIGTCPIHGDGAHHLGPLVVNLAITTTAASTGAMPRVSWSVANRGDTAVRPWSVAVVFTVAHRGPLRMFRHGYQSWSPCDVATLGVHHDPSLDNPTRIELVQGVHHADQRTARPDELRSEFVTVLADADTPMGADAAGKAIAVGFDAGVDHDGTFRLRPGNASGGNASGGNGSGGPTPSAAATAELWAEAFLGGARLDPGTSLALHGFAATTDAPVAELLTAWAALVGTAGAARTAAAFQVGWCSWYHYFHDVTEAHLRSNLAASGSWPFDVFQLDDGYQAAIGDWLDTNAKFPSDIAGLASAIAASGHTPGIWLAPFIAAPDSQLATAHPDWMARTHDGAGPLPGMFNPPWGGGMGGIMLALDTTNPEVLDHLTGVARQLRDAGYDYLKLDFTFAPSFDGVFSDPTRTPAQRVRAGYDAIRAGAGDDAFILGCGAPISHVVGAVDGNRIGSDVDPRWTLDPARADEAYPDALPATLHAFRNTLARSFMHRSLWLNDPDCVMLRTTETDLDPAGVRTWAETVAVSGGMVLVSDDLALLDATSRALLDEVIAVGREVDAESQAGSPPVCDDLLDASPPGRLRSARRSLVVDTSTGHGKLAGI